MDVRITARQVLLYDYVENAIEARAPYREAHVAHLRAWMADGRLVLGGALGDPPTGGLLVFDAGVDVEAFVAADPYVAGGVVTGHRVEPFNVVD